MPNGDLPARLLHLLSDFESSSRMYLGMGSDPALVDGKPYEEGYYTGKGAGLEMAAAQLRELIGQETPGDRPAIT